MIMSCSLHLLRHHSRSQLLNSPNVIPRLSINVLSRTSQKQVLRSCQSLFSTSPQACSSTYHGLQSQYPRTTSKYVIRENLLGTKSPLRMIIIGAGVSGLDMLYTLQKKTENIEYVIYEKNPEGGGTWYENRYPGCASDDPSHHYQYTHTTNPSWSSVFAPAQEINRYLNNFIDNNSLRSNIKCNHQIHRAEWIDTESHWKVTVKNEATGQVFIEYSNILIDATGIFNDFKYPDITGLKSFQGDLIHTADWASDFNYHGKTVAVLGNGASGVQIVPAIQPDVKKLVHIIRSKTWIAPPSKTVEFCNQHTISGATDLFRERWKKSMVKDPMGYQKFLNNIDELARKDRFKTVLKSSLQASTSKNRITAYMASQLRTHPHLLNRLMPSTPIGCRRLTSSTTYLPSLCQPNVQVSTSPIKEITATGILLSCGTFHKVDAIICATGFNTSFIPRFPIYGANHINLQETWTQRNGGPKAYMGICVENMPNYFRFLGPNSPLAHGAIPHLSSTISAYILSHIQKMQVESYDSVVVQPKAVQEFNEHIDAFMPRMAWADGCGGWYRSGEDSVNGHSRDDRRVTALHPGSQEHWENMVSQVRWEDFEYSRNGGNRFGYLGNGEVAVGEVMEEEGEDSFRASSEACAA